ncbi:MAG: hypothetical protein AAFU85_33935, partial [Planctomycetota bacterium]
AMSLPDSITNPTTPVDQHGESISDGWYRLVRRRTRPVYVEVRFDPDAGELICLPRESERPQRVDEMDPGVRWELVDASDVPN